MGRTQDLKIVRELSEASIRRCLRFFEVIDEKGGVARKWDLIKVAGNEAGFKRWVEDFLIYHHFLEKIEDKERVEYRKTERGKTFQSLLKDYGYVMAFRRISGKKLRSVADL